MSQYKNFFQQAGNAYGTDWRLLNEVAKLESSFNPNAINNWDSNAKAGTPSAGLFQFKQPTFNAFSQQARKANPNAWKGLGSPNWKDWRQQALTASWAFSNGKGSHWATYNKARGQLGQAGKGGSNPFLGEGGSVQLQSPGRWVGGPDQKRMNKISFAYGDEPELGQAMVDKYVEDNQPKYVPGASTNVFLGDGTAGTGTMGKGMEGVLGTAASEVGTLAQDAMKYIRAAGGTGQEAWCGDFVQYLFKKNGLKAPPARSVPALLSWAKKNDRFSRQAQRGRLAMFDWNHDGVADHVGLVTGVGKHGYFNTIEGNTGGGRGRGVYRKRRHMSDILGFATPNY